MKHEEIQAACEIRTHDPQFTKLLLSPSANETIPLCTE